MVTPTLHRKVENGERFAGISEIDGSFASHLWLVGSHISMFYELVSVSEL